ncbi:MAG TPA: NAD(P)-dependent oxidoreductase, partial [Opitutus sp.]|nr:NAD(P)-dependent oxidoreductase [Opitutus sp.]
AEAQQLNVQLVSLEEIFATADVVSCHMPLTDATQRSLGRPHFAAMKPGATFINTARGLLVRENELIDVLKTRPDLHAVLDVMESEPPPPESPLFSLPNVVMTPHIAGSIGTECRRMGTMILDEVQRYLAHEPLRGEVWQEQLNTLA